MRFPSNENHPSFSCKFNTVSDISPRFHCRECYFEFQSLSQATHLNILIPQIHMTIEQNRVWVSHLTFTKNYLTIKKQLKYWVPKTITTEWGTTRSSTNISITIIPCAYSAANVSLNVKYHVFREGQSKCVKLTQVFDVWTHNDLLLISRTAKKEISKLLVIFISFQLCFRHRRFYSWSGEAKWRQFNFVHHWLHLYKFDQCPNCVELQGQWNIVQCAFKCVTDRS